MKHKRYTPKSEAKRKARERRQAQRVKAAMQAGKAGHNA